MPCSNAAKTQNPLKCVGVPQTPEPISAVSGPKFTILSGHVEEVLLLNKFFSDCRYMPQLRRYGPTKLCDGLRWRFLATFLRPVFAASRVQHVSDLHVKFALRPHHVWQTSNLRRLRLGEEKKKEEEQTLSLIHIWRCRRIERCRSRWSPYH